MSSKFCGLGYRLVMNDIKISSIMTPILGALSESTFTGFHPSSKLELLRTALIVISQQEKLMSHLVYQVNHCDH